MLRKVKRKVKEILKCFGFYKPKNNWPKPSKNQIKYLIANVKIKTSLETINEIKDTVDHKQKGAYMRFGDGDIYLMLGLNDMLHIGNKRMAKEMKEAIKLNIGKLHKGLPIHSKLFGYEKGMDYGVHLVSDKDALKYLSVTYRFLNIKKLITSFALHHLATTDIDACVNFLKFLRNTNPIFVGNEKINSGLVEKLFGKVHVKTPSRDSYSEIDRIEDELMAVLKTKNKEFQVVVVAMGCPGRILQKRILKKGYNVYLFDFGSLLDAFNGEDTRDWIELTGGINYYFELLNKLDN